MFAKRDGNTLDKARQVLKDVSDWQKNAISDLEHKKRTFRTEELYNVVDAIGQNEAQVEAARVKQLVREHIMAAEEEVKKMVSEQVKVNSTSTNPQVPESKIVTKFSSRLPRVALLPPKGRKISDKVNQAEQQNRPASETKVLPKRPPPKPRPKTLSELMESRVKPLPSSVLEEFGISANRVQLPGKTKITGEPTSTSDLRCMDYAIPLAPPMRSRPLGVSVNPSPKSSEKVNVAVINITPEEKEIPKLNLQVLPSIDIQSRTRLLQEDKRTNFKLINVMDPETETKEKESQCNGELPGSQPTNLLHASRRDNFRSKDPTTIQKHEGSSYDPPQTTRDLLQPNSIFQRIEQFQPHVPSPNISQTFHLDNGQSRKVLPNGNRRMRNVHPYLMQERLQGGSGSGQPSVGQLHSSSPSSGLTSDNLFRTIAGRWTEQELIARITQELTQNTRAARTDNRQQRYFINDDLIKQLVLEVIQEDLLARTSVPQTPSPNGSGKKTEVSPETTRAVNSHSSEKSGKIEVPVDRGDFGKSSLPEENRLKAKEAPERSGSADVVSPNFAERTEDRKLTTDSTNNVSSKKLQGDDKNLSSNKILDPDVLDTNGVAETTKIETSKDEGLKRIAPFTNVIPRDIAVHVFIEDKRSADRKGSGSSLKNESETPAEVGKESGKAKLDREEVVPATNVPTDAGVRKKSNSDAEEKIVDSESARLDFKKEYREIGVNAVFEPVKELTSTGTQVESVSIDLLLSPELNAQNPSVSPISPIKSSITSSEDEECQHKSVRDVGIQLSSGHASSSTTTTTDNTTLTTTTSSEEPISEGELLFKYHGGVVRPSTLDSTLQSIDEGEITRTLSDGEIAVRLEHPLERALSVGEIQETEEMEESHVVTPPLTEPKTKVGKREDRSRLLKLTSSSFSEGEITQRQSSSSSELDPSSTGTSPDIALSLENFKSPVTQDAFVGQNN